MNNDTRSPMPLMAAKTRHNTARLSANATRISDRVCGGNVESFGMSAYIMPVPCGRDAIKEGESFFASSFWRMVLPIVIPHTLPKRKDRPMREELRHSRKQMNE